MCHSHRPPHSPSPVGAPLVGALPPILPLAAHHPKPSPVIPRLREEPHRPTLNTPLIPLLCAIPTAHRTPPFPVGAPLVGALPPILPLATTILCLPQSSRGSARNLTTPLSTPLNPITVRHSRHPTRPSSPTWPSPVGALPPILPIAAHHPIPSPVIPRLREEPHRPTLNATPSHYCAPFPPLTALPFPHMAVPRGRPPPILPIAAHHPKPSPLVLAHAGTHLSSSPPSAIPRLREESPHPTLNTPPSHYYAPFPPPTALPLSP